MTSINENTIITPRIHLRSTTRRRNNPNALARRTQALETRRTNLGNTIRELAADLRQQRSALDAKTIEVKRSLTRRDDDGERYERLRTERDNLRYTLLTDFNQSNLGMEYKELKRQWTAYVNNEDEDTDINYFNNLKPRFDHVSALFDELIETGLAPIIEQKALARETYRLASTHHYNLYQQQQSIMRVVSDLERRLKTALIRERLLNQARGSPDLPPPRVPPFSAPPMLQRRPNIGTRPTSLVRQLDNAMHLSLDNLELNLTPSRAPSSASSTSSRNAFGKKYFRARKITRRKRGAKKTRRK